MDPLSDVLRAVRLDGAFFFVIEAWSPWSLNIGAARALEPRVLPNSEHLIAYHILTAGRAWAGPPGGTQVCLQPGDAILFPHGMPHFLSGERGVQVFPGTMNSRPERYLEWLRMDGPGESAATFVCGFLGCDAFPFNPLLASLPPMLHMPSLTTGWLAEFPRQVIAESQQQREGASTMLTRMAELMFIEVVRRHLASDASAAHGWLAGLRDPVVAPALIALHARPAHAWTLSELAAEASASRSVLAERFTDVVGVPPMQYLTQWRLQLAAEQLASCTDKISAISMRVGYESDAAFSRAFKRATGKSPAAWRRQRAS